MSDHLLRPENIKAVRERLGETQAAFGRRFGVDQSTVHRWETEGVSRRGATRVAVEHVLRNLPTENLNEAEARAAS
jgi:DNA-binding transcriptional regulator YiaG